VLIALACLVLSAASIVASLVTFGDYYR
jgi:hypothetical protein